MKRFGTCSKCGEYKLVHDHHYKGYDAEEVLPYCQSCDIKAHNSARKEGRCKISSEESHKKSTASNAKRTWKTFILSLETPGSNTRLFEVLQLNLKTDKIMIWSGFNGNNRKKLKIIDEI
jgi:hypothetical protein